MILFKELPNRDKQLLREIEGRISKEEKELRHTVFDDYLNRAHKSPIYQKWTDKQKKAHDEIILKQKALDGTIDCFIHGTYLARFSQLLLVFTAYKAGLEN